MNIDIAIKTFAKFLNNSWNLVLPLLKNRNYTLDELSMDDWIQANWELLVERKLLPSDKYLEIYGAGADFYGESSRITDPEAQVNFVVDIKSNKPYLFDYLNLEEFSLENCKFSELVSFKNNFYKREPNFEYALLDDNDLERVVKLSNITFQLKEVRSKK